MISMYTDGISKVEIAQQLDLPEAKISEVIRDLRSPEFTDALLDHAVRLHYDGSDLDKHHALLQASNVLRQQGARPDQATELATDIPVLCSETGMCPEKLCKLFGSYRRIARSGIDTFEELKKRTRKVGDPRASFKADLMKEEDEYKSLCNKLNKKPN